MMVESHSYKAPPEEIIVIMRVKVFQYCDYDTVKEFEEEVNTFIIDIQLSKMPNQLLPIPNGILVMYGTPEEEI